jgi:eukaryotic-like serine/threonine-protein kinase
LIFVALQYQILLKWTQLLNCFLLNCTAVDVEELLMIGKTLGHYQISKQIGKGGMGEVYQAKDQTLGRAVAIKVLPEEFAKDADRIARLQREAKLLASLNHPNIAAIYGLEESNGTNFLVMELVEGQTLADGIKGGAIPVEEALKLALQISEALEAAHEKGVIHRDLKPANIKVTPDGKVKVLDFGLAKAYVGDQDLNLSNSPTLSDAATHRGVILGTAAYMSPEQARGKAVDKRTDIWAFGCVMYEMLTGQAAFQGEDVTEILAAIVKGGADLNLLPANIHPRMREVLIRCLQKDMRRRYSGIGDARYEIEQVLADPNGAFLRSVQEVAPRAKLRTALPWAITAILCLIIVGAAVWYLKPPPSPEAKRVVRFEYDLPEDQQLTGLHVSPDGRQIVYSTTKGLFIRSVDELNARPIAGTEGIAYDLFFSPDGKYIAYFARNDKSLKKIAIGGGTPVTVLENYLRTQGLSWGPDNTILYGDYNGIMRVSANGGTPEIVVKATSGPLFSPQMLPDGKSVLYMAYAGNNQSMVMVQSPQLGKPKELFAGAGARYISPGYIIYLLHSNTYAVAFDPIKLEAKGDPVPLLEGTLGGAVSDAGTLVYVPKPAAAAQTAPTASSRSTLVWMNLEGKEESLRAPSNWYHTPAISPDKTKVASAALIDANLDIYVWDLARETLMRLTFEKGSDGLPIWTPDGKRIIFFSEREGNRGIYWKAADGAGQEEKLVSDPDKNLFPYCLSKDGKNLVVVEMDSAYTKSDIGIVSMEGDHAVKLLLKEPYLEMNPSISPDGKYMAYLSTDPKGPGIYVCPFPDVSKGKWQISGSGAEFARWSPDGRELYYNTKDAIMAVSVETEPSFKPGKTRQLFRANLENGYGSSPSWDISSDGKRFLVVKLPETSGAAPPASAPRKMIVVLNWFEELKRLAHLK